MTIDAKLLEEAIALGDRWNLQGDLRTLLEAARAHLATLPRTKEVEIVQWAALAGERVVGIWKDEAGAKNYVGQDDRYQIVRLSAMATVPA